MNTINKIKQPKMIIFDVDGVLLSEERCFDATTLTVWELLTSERYLHLPSRIPFTPTPDEAVVQEVRQDVFAQEAILHQFKAKGLNSNWQMVYLLAGYYLIEWLATRMENGQMSRNEVEAWLAQPITDQRLQGLQADCADFTFPDFLRHDVYLAWLAESDKDSLLQGTCLDRHAKERLGIEFAEGEGLFSSSRTFWQLGHDIFQEWYIGEAYTRQLQDPLRQEGKRGFLQAEIPLLPPEELQSFFRELHERGIILGIATGRPRLETEVPLTSLGIFQYLDTERVVTADEVMDAEKRGGSAIRLSKPHPYCYLQAIRSRTDAVEECVEACRTSLPLQDADDYLIVGDSIADALAAKDLGVPFAGVYSGMVSEQRKAAFIELGAVLLLENVNELL